MARATRALALLLILLVLTACGEVPQAQIEDGPETGVQTVKIWADQTQPGLDDVIHAYYQRYPNVRVEKVVPLPDEQRQPLDTLVATKIADRAVDIVPFTYEALTNKLLLPLDSYVQKSGFDLKPLDALMPALRWDGKLYQLPYQVYGQTLLYNKDLFDTLHIDVPTGVMTWDQFRTLAGRFQERDHQIWGFWTMVPEQLVTLYTNQRRNGEVRQLTVAEMTEALQFFSTMVVTDKAMPPTDKRDWTQTEWSFKSTKDFFQMGGALMSLGSLNYRQGGPRMGFKLGVMPLPTLAGSTGGMPVFPVSYGIAANSRHAEAAFQFLAFLAGPEGQAIYARSGALPAYRTPEVRQAWIDQEGAPIGAAAILDGTWSVTPNPTTAPKEKPKPPDPASNPYVPANAVLSGQQSVADAVAAWAKAAKAQ